MNLTRKKIGDIVNLQQGLCINKKTEYLLSKEGIPLLRITDLINNTKEKFINKDLVQKKFIIDYNDIIYTRTGQVGLVFKNKKGILHNNCFKVWSNKEEVLDEYIYWYLKQKHIIEYVNHVAAGAAQPDLNHDAFKSIDFVFPDKDIQYKIIQILSNYDDLIENNNKRIKILEEMAQIIYKEWFVDFKFPGAKNATFKDSELGKIPSDFTVEKVVNLILNIESGSRPKGGINPNDCDIPSIGAENILGLGKYDYTKEKFISADFYQNMSKGKINNLDILLYKDGAQLGRKSIFGEGFPHDKCCVNEHVFILRPNEKISSYYLYFTLDTKSNTEKIKLLNTNAAQPGINQEQVKSLEILKAPKYLIDKFDIIMQPIVSQIFKLCIKNETLKQTRDILLPRLIAGEIDVENLEIV